MNDFNNRSTLILITSHYPFGEGESFLETEINFLITAFDQIVIISRDVRNKQTRKIPEKAMACRYNPSSGLNSFLYLPVLFISNFSTFLKAYHSEKFFRKENACHFGFNQKKITIKAIIKALQLKRFIERKISQLVPENEIHYYSYWMNSGAHAIGMIDNKKAIKITRAHGSDLYEEIHKSGFLPLQYFTCNNLDHIFLISDYGLEYMKERYPSQTNKMSVSRLGVSFKNKINTPTEQNYFTIVSCSSLIPLKRVNIIIEALGLLEDVPVQWLHFGDGPLKKNLTELAKKTFQMKKHLKWSFMGHISNTELLEFYNNNKINLFINTSASEGIPVSIMEAQMFGIPALATDCGGIKEVLVTGTGILLPSESDAIKIASSIEKFIKMDQDEYLEYCKNASLNQKDKFSADKNYLSFISEIHKLIQHKKYDI